MKCFIGHLVEGKIKGVFNDIWIRLGLYHAPETADLAAKMGPMRDTRVLETRITPYFHVRGPEGRDIEKPVVPAARPRMPARSPFTPARSPLRKAFRSRMGEVCRQAV